MIKKCPKCKEDVEGEDLGDKETWLTFDCECGHRWDEDCSDYFAYLAELAYDRAKEEGYAG